MANVGANKMQRLFTHLAKSLGVVSQIWKVNLEFLQADLITHTLPSLKI